MSSIPSEKAAAAAAATTTRSLVTLNLTELDEQTLSAYYTCSYNNLFNYTQLELDQLLNYKHIINGWISLVIIIVGMLANSVTICALLHKYLRKSSTNAYLLALTFSNMVSLLCLFFMTALRFTIVHPYRLVYCRHWYESYISLFIPYLTPVNNMFQLSGIYLIIALSIDRLVIIRKPSKPTEASRRKRRHLTWAIISAIFAFCFIFTLPNWFLYTTTKTTMTLTRNDYYELKSANETWSALIGADKPLNYTLYSYRLDYTRFGREELVRKIIGVYLYIPFVFCVPIVVLLVVNFLIIFELVKIGNRKRQLGSHINIDRNITIMLVMIVIIFLISQIPLAILHIIISRNPLLLYNKSFFIFNALVTCLTCINQTVNFALLCFFGQAFRDTIKYMFGLRKDLPSDTKGGGPNGTNVPHNYAADFRRSSVIQYMLKSIYSQENIRANGSHGGVNGVDLNEKRRSMPALRNDRRSFMFHKKKNNNGSQENRALLKAGPVGVSESTEKVYCTPYKPSLGQIIEAKSVDRRFSSEV